MREGILLANEHYGDIDLESSDSTPCRLWISLKTKCRLRHSTKPTPQTSLNVEEDSQAVEGKNRMLT